jgi:iron complex transport system substrate-binding protein
VLDYGDVSQRYVDRIKLIQDNTGVPAILIDGTLAKAPAAFRQAGTVLGRSDRAEALAELAEDLFASVPPKPDKPVRVLVLRPGDTPMAAQPGTPATEVVSMLGWTPVAPPSDDSAHSGGYKPTTAADVATLDPDVIVFTGPDAAATVAKDQVLHGLRAVRDGRAFYAPTVPFGWIDEPPSVNRLLGLEWLEEGSGAVSGMVLSSLLFRQVPDVKGLAMIRNALHLPPP